MWTQQPVQKVDPLCLPVGLRIGPWRVVGFGGRGAYGTLYCVERAGHEADGPGGLKLATHPTVHYPASTCDDLFALGVMAYRLVTDVYPPLTQPGEPGAEVWSGSGSGPRRPSELNPRVSPPLDALILRLLAVAPVERFHGRAEEAVEAMERVVQDGESGMDAPLFEAGYDHLPCWRSPEKVRIFEERDVAAREQFARKQEERREELLSARLDAEAERALEPHAVEERDRADAAMKQSAPRARVRVWGAEAVVAAVGLLLAGVLGVGLHEGPGGGRAFPAEAVHDRSTGAVGRMLVFVRGQLAPLQGGRIRMEGSLS